MNKKIISLLTALILIFGCFVLPAFADSSSDLKSIYDSSEIGEVLKAVGNDALTKEYEASRVNSLQNDNSESSCPYKLYSISPSELRGINSEAVKSIIASDDYKWIVPGSTNEIIKVAKSDGNWKVLGYSTSDGDFESAESALGESVNDILKAVQTEGASEIKTDNSNESYLCFEIPQYYTYFLGTFSENESYVIPYGSRPDWTGLENGKKYSPEAAAEILKTNFNISEADYNAGNDNGGGSSAEAESGNNLWLLSIPAAALVVFLLILFLKQKQRRKQQ